MKKNLYLLVCLLLFGQSLSGQSTYQWKTASSAGNAYRYVTNDPTKSRFYTLKNGLTVILSENRDEPNIQFRMAVRAGSNNDPRNATGLAHYLEHLLFKGTDRFGTMDYAKEKPLLDKIVALYQQYNVTTDPAERKKIYAEIDKTSGEASNYSIANEYSTMMKSIGGQITNAHTWYEETVYQEDFPSNSVDKFLALQAERFRAPVFRIFHTELEAVYEEKNRTMDNDGWKTYEKLNALLFPTHNYGQQTTIGTVEHLKNPSLVEIRKYYDEFYVPNNMALVLSGDFNPDEMIKKVEASFSYMKSKPIPAYTPAAEKPLLQIQRADIYGPNAETLTIGYRGYAESTRQSMLLELIASILYNEKAGLLDINLNKKQLLLSSSVNYQQMKDYGVFQFTAQPKQGQTLNEVEQLLLGQIALLKKGDFDESLIKATVANKKLSLLRYFDRNDFRAEALSNEFILNRASKWDQSLNNLDAMARLSRKEVVDFANQYFKNNYVVILKHKAEDKSIQKVEKPVITAVKTNSNETSPFKKALLAGESKPIAPRFLDYKTDLNFGKAGIADVVTVQNKENGIFSLSYRFDMGTWNNKLAPVAAKYLAYLGTDKYTAEEISKQFYNIACNYTFSVNNEITTITITGLQENFEQALKLTEHVFDNCKPNEAALTELKSSILKSRENAKLNKDAILAAVSNYAQFGPLNPANFVLSNEEINQLTAEQLVAIIHQMKAYKHSINYYGPQTLDVFSKNIEKIHELPAVFKDPNPAHKFTYTDLTANKVYFANYDMVQSEIRWLRNTGIYDPAQAAKINLFNSYFGADMGSLVFQTLRESKALAYSTYAYYFSPDTKNKQFYMVGYVGSQADKMPEAVAAMNELLNDLPEFEKNFETAKNSALNALETSRITKEGIINRYYADKRLGFDQDSRIEQYRALKPLNFKDLKDFHTQYIAHKPYNYSIIASDKRLKTEDMQKFGELKILTLEQIFGY